MKKFLRFMIVLLVVLVAGILVLAIVEPNDITVTRSILIKAPKEAVFEQMVKFKNWPNWSPFYELDTTAKLTYTGTDGSEGSSFSWESKKNDVGAGSMTNTAVKGTEMDYHLDFLKPFKSMATGLIKASDSAGMTKATWTFSTHVPFPMNAMQVLPFMSMEKMLGGSFEHGLDKMKKFVESHAMEVTSDIDIKEVDYPGHYLQGIRKTIPMSDIGKFCGETYDLVKKGVEDKINGPAVGVYYTWDTTNKTTDMAAAYQVSDTAVTVKGLSCMYLDASKAYMAVLKGGYSGEMKIHTSLAKYVAAKGKTMTHVLEEYIALPKNEPDSNKWVTNIYYFVK